MTYDALDRVVEEGPTLQILYGPTGKLGVQSGQTNTRTYLGLPKGAQVLYDGSSVLYVHPDLMGNGILGTNNAQGKVFDRLFAPFGEEYDNSGTTVANFTGNMQDLDANLYDYTYREQSPVQGRWLNPDPSGMSNVSLGDPQTLNRYAYVRGSAMGLTDVNGLGAGAGAGSGMWAYLMSFTATGGQGGIYDNGGIGTMTADQAAAQQLNQAQQLAANAQQQNGSSNGVSFWSHLSNLLHGHSWNYVNATVTAEDVGPHEVKQEPNEAVTAATDAAGIVGIVAPKLAKETHLGPLGAGASIANDPSPKNTIFNLLGLTDLFGPGFAIIGTFNDYFFEYEINNSTPGPRKINDSDHLQLTIPVQDGGCQATGLPSC